MDKTKASTNLICYNDTDEGKFEMPNIKHSSQLRRETCIFNIPLLQLCMECYTNVITTNLTINCFCHPDLFSYQIILNEKQNATQIQISQGQVGQVEKFQKYRGLSLVRLSLDQGLRLTILPTYQSESDLISEFGFWSLDFRCFFSSLEAIIQRLEFDKIYILYIYDLTY